MKDARVQALIAEELSALLIDTYQGKHLPDKIKLFSKAGFTKSELLKKPEKLYMLLILSAYDRRPYTGAEGVYDYVWGFTDQENSLQRKISLIGLGDPISVLSMTRNEIKDILRKETLNGFGLDDDGHIDFSKTFHNIAFTWDYLYTSITKAGNYKDIYEIYNILINIHGIGEIIAAKLIKFIFREVSVGNVKKKDFPLSVVWPLIKDYYIEQGILKLRTHGSDIIPLTMAVLMYKGDPFAIDAFYYLERYEPQKIDKFINKTQNWESNSGSGSMLFNSGDVEASGMDKAELLLSVIKDICNDSTSLRLKDLEGMAHPRQLRANANKIFKNMKKYAFSGDVENMYLYYQKCLVSEPGAWDWLLENVGRKSMRSEWERFQHIYRE